MVAKKKAPAKRAAPRKKKLTKKDMGTLYKFDQFMQGKVSSVKTWSFFFYTLIFGAGVVAGSSFFDAPPAPIVQTLHGTEIQPCFSPGGNCTGWLEKHLENAEQSIEVQAYSFTSEPLQKALLNAHKRGVDVAIILDKGHQNENRGALTTFVRAGIPVWVDERVAIAHNKVMIVDNDTVFTGSFNFTSAAESRNAENMIMIKSPETANSYHDYFETRKGVSKRIVR